MAKIRKFDFIVGVETSTAPTASDPVGDGDAVTLGYANSHYTQGGASVATIAALKAVLEADRADGDLILVVATENIYAFDSGSSASNDDNFVLEPDAGSGRWLRAPKDVATLTDTQVLTNKDYDGGVAANTRRITLPQDTSANLAALSRKEGTIAYDTDQNLPVFDTGSAFQALAAATLSDAADNLQNLSIATSVDSNILTIALKNKGGGDATAPSSIKIGFRDATLTTGTYDVVTVTSSLSMDVVNGATLGHSAQTELIYVYAINNSGTAELAVSNYLFDTGTIVSTTVMNTSSDNRTVMYSTTARSNVPVRLIGRLKIDQASPGVWVNNSSEITPVQLIGRTAPLSEVVMTGGSGHGSSATAIRELTTTLVLAGSGIVISTGSTNGTSFVIKENGMYAMSYTDFDGASDRDMGISRNSSELETNIASITNADRLVMTNTPLGNIRANCSVTRLLNADDAIRPHTGGTMSGSTDSVVMFSIAQVYRL